MASPTDLKKGRQFSVLSAAAFGTLESLTEDVDGIEARLKVVEAVAAGVEIKLEAGRCLSTALPRRASRRVISQGLPLTRSPEVLTASRALAEEITAN